MRLIGRRVTYRLQKTEDDLQSTDDDRGMTEDDQNFHLQINKAI